MYDDVLYKSCQVIVPASLRPELLRKIHKAHQGADSSIRRARESTYWPGMPAGIRETCLSCGVCAQYLSERPREPMRSHQEKQNDKYNDLNYHVKILWKCNKIHAMPVITCALGTAHEGLEGWLEKTDIKDDFTMLQKPICLLGQLARNMSYALNT